jgi:hypothetical protein
MKIAFKIFLYTCASLGLLVMPHLILFLFNYTSLVSFEISFFIVSGLPSLSLAFYVLDYYFSKGGKI